jgi:hypothetical protein
MARNYVAFDIETAKIIPGEVGDLKAHRPLGITCAATLSDKDEKPRLWYGRTGDAPAGQMSREDAAELVKFLVQLTDNGSTILTWNGLGFDFDILAEESGMLAECKRLARTHVDMMFHVLCDRGFPIGLDAAAKGMGHAGKSKDVAQHLAPDLWAEGRTDEVLAYVSQDVQATLDLALACEKDREMRWIARSGRANKMKLPSGWCTVEEALRLPEPDTSWMDNPLTRDKFTDWL